MKVLIVGAGSIGCRHIKNIHDLFPDAGIDVYRSGKGHELAADIECIINSVFSGGYENVTEFYDAIFITNSTTEHYTALRALMKRSEAFFIEKPIFERTDYEMDLFSDKTIYVACPIRYTSVIQELLKIDLLNVQSVRCISSSYLPDWRPGTNYRKCYSANKSLGGGVSLDLIHEWDYLIYIFGKPKNVKSIIAKKGDVTVDSDDIAIYIADYEDKVLELHVDYIGRVPRRIIEIITEDEVIVCDIINCKIKWLKSGEERSFDENRDDYQKKELQHFFDIATGTVKNDNDMNTAIDTLKIALGET